MNIIFAIFTFSIGLTLVSSARNYETLGKIASSIADSESLIVLKEEMPGNVRILLYEPEHKILIVQEDSGDCYALFESTISPANHRFGKIIMIDPWNIRMVSGESLMWNHATLLSISSEEITISLVRVTPNKSDKDDQLVLLRRNAEQNSKWKLNSPP